MEGDLTDASESDLKRMAFGIASVTVCLRPWRAWMAERWAGLSGSVRERRRRDIGLCHLAAWSPPAGWALRTADQPQNSGRRSLRHVAWHRRNGVRLAVSSRKASDAEPFCIDQVPVRLLWARVGRRVA